MKIAALIILGIVAAEGLKRPTFDPDRAIRLTRLDAIDALQKMFDQESDTLENVLDQVSWVLWKTLENVLDQVSWVLWKEDNKKVC